LVRAPKLVKRGRHFNSPPNQFLPIADSTLPLVIALVSSSPDVDCIAPPSAASLIAGSLIKRNGGTFNT